MVLLRELILVSVFGGIWYEAPLCVSNSADRLYFGKGTKLLIQTSK